MTGFQDRCNLLKLIHIGYNHGSNWIEAFGFNRFKVKFQQKIAFLYAITSFYLRGEILSFKGDGISSHMDNQFNSVVIFQAEGMAGFKDKKNISVKWGINPAFGWKNCCALS